MLKKQLAVLAVVGLVTVSGCGKQPEAAPTTVEATPVKVAQVSSDDIISNVKISGRVQAAMEVSVVPKINGKVMQVKGDVGQRVRKGDVLVVLDDSDIRARIKVNQAAVQLSRSGQQSAVIAYEEAKTNLDRSRYLFQQGAISQKQLEDAENAFSRAAASYAPNSSSTQTSAQIQQAQAQLEAAQVELANTKVVAPIDGIIAARNIDPGEMASPSAPLFTIVNTDQMLVEANLAENEVNIIKVGTNVQVNVSAAGDKPFQGIVESISPAANNATKAYPIKIKMKNDGQLLKSGMMAELQLTSQAKHNVLVIPKGAILDRGGDKVVFVVKDKKAEERKITSGVSTDTILEITSGLVAGEQIVVSGQQVLSNGVEVEIQK